MLQRLMVFLGGGAVQGWLEQAPVVVLMRRPDGSLLEPSLEWIVGPQQTFAVLRLLLLLCFEKYMPVTAILHKIMNGPSSLCIFNSL